MTSGERRTAERLEQKRDDDKSFNGDDEAAELPSSMRLMDMPQEQLARRCARRVGRVCTRLIPGLGRLAANCFVPRTQALGVAYRTPIHPDPVRARCLFDPPQGRGDGHRVFQFPSGQYQVVLIDEGGKPFSFKSVGIQAQGRTTILKINYRNTRQILQTASLVAADLLTAHDKDEDGVPMLKPVSCGREGEVPLIVRLPTLRAEASRVAELLGSAHQDGHAWGDMAIICRHYSELDECAGVLRQRCLPHQVRKGAGSFDPAADTIKVLTMHTSKGLEFPVVALVGAGRMPAEGEDEREDAKLFYMCATRAVKWFMIEVVENGKFPHHILKEKKRALATCLCCKK
jgi:hypothetical protein